MAKNPFIFRMPEGHTLERVIDDGSEPVSPCIRCDLHNVETRDCLDESGDISGKHGLSNCLSDEGSNNGYLFKVVKQCE